LIILNPRSFSGAYISTSSSSARQPQLLPCALFLFFFFVCTQLRHRCGSSVDWKRTLPYPYTTGPSQPLPVSCPYTTRLGLTFAPHDARPRGSGRGAAFTSYSFPSRLLCTNQFSFHYPLPLALPALLQYDCTSIAQYTTPHPSLLLYAIHHTVLVMAISCKGQGEVQFECRLETDPIPIRLSYPNRCLCCVGA